MNEIVPYVVSFMFVTLWHFRPLPNLYCMDLEFYQYFLENTNIFILFYDFMKLTSE